MFLQALIGVWPIELLENDDPKLLAELRERFDAYVPKALREAKLHSKWIEPNEDYEKATTDLIDRLLAEGSRFITRLRPILQDIAKRGMLVSLGRTILKCTVPGVPDFYQGTGLFDFSLVDPDNRRPVDYAQRGSILKDGDTLEDLISNWQDGAIKLRLASGLLRDRRENALFYAKADYAALPLSGAEADKLIAFVRHGEGQALAVIVPRLTGAGKPETPSRSGVDFWGDTTIELPAGTWHDVFEGRSVASNGHVEAGALLGRLPFAVLRKA